MDCARGVLAQRFRLFLASAYPSRVFKPSRHVDHLGPGPGEGFVLRKEPAHGEVCKDAEDSLEVYRPLNLVRPVRLALG